MIYWYLSHLLNVFYTDECTAMKRVRYQNIGMNLLIHYHDFLPGCVAESVRIWLQIRV